MGHFKFPVAENIMECWAYGYHTSVVKNAGMFLYKVFYITIIRIYSILAGHLQHIIIAGCETLGQLFLQPNSPHRVFIMRKIEGILDMFVTLR